MVLKVALGALLAGSVFGDYSKTEDWNASNFFSHFNFNTFNDPTHGYVDYQGAGTNLAYTQNGKVYMKVDTTQVASGRGRKSVRISSKKNWKNGLFILDVEHMPDGCGSWPAWWFNGDGHHWPECGEIDVIEYVHRDTTNHATLHTSPGCRTSGNTGVDFTGAAGERNCNANNGFNGCGIKFADSNTAAGGWNAQGGGVYIMERVQDVSIKVWYFHRNHIPDDILQDRPNPANWGLPAAAWSMTQGACSGSHFVESTMIFDITFCGDWAGAGGVWGSMCPNEARGGRTCQNYVQYEGNAYREAYWAINYVKVFQGSGGSVPTPPSPNSQCTPVGQDPYQTGHEVKCCAGHKKCLKAQYNWSYRCQECGSSCPDDRDWYGRQCNSASTFATPSWAMPAVTFSASEAPQAAEEPQTNCACTGIAAGCDNEGESCYVGSETGLFGADKCVPGACASPRQCKCMLAEGKDSTFCWPFAWKLIVPKCKPVTEAPKVVEVEKIGIIDRFAARGFGRQTPAPDNGRNNGDAFDRLVSAFKKAMGEFVDELRDSAPAPVQQPQQTRLDKLRDRWNNFKNGGSPSTPPPSSNPNSLLDWIQNRFDGIGNGDAGAARAPPPNTCSQEDGHNSMGVNMSGSADYASSAGECCSKCLAKVDQGCVGYTWVKDNQECWLKSAVDSGHYDQHVVSGSVGSGGNTPVPPPPSGGGDADWCPSAGDLTTAYGNPELRDGGWTIRNGGGAATKATFNVLGGYAEFDIDVSGVGQGVNANIYTISPRISGGGYQGGNYCDGAENDKPWCVEMDWIESNGSCGAAATVHTKPGGGNDGCSAWGCRSVWNYGGKSKYHVKAEYSTDGKMSLTVDGRRIEWGSLSPTPDGQAAAKVREQYQSLGALIYSSQWSGWVPTIDGCSNNNGNENGSVFSISNLKIKGPVVQGPTPRRC